MDIPCPCPECHTYFTHYPPVVRDLLSDTTPFPRTVAAPRARGPRGARAPRGPCGSFGDFMLQGVLAGRSRLGYDENRLSSKFEICDAASWMSARA